MIDLHQVRYSLVAVSPFGPQLTLDGVLRGLQWEEQPAELAVRLTADLASTEVQGRELYEHLPLMAPVQLLSDWGQGWREVFRGTIRARHLRDDSVPVIEIVAFDQLYPLARSRDDFFFARGTTAKEALRSILETWAIPLGTTQWPEVVLEDDEAGDDADLEVVDPEARRILEQNPLGATANAAGRPPRLAQKVFRGRPIGEAIAWILERVERQGGGRYLLRSADGLVHVLRVGQNTPVYRLPRALVVSWEHGEDIQDLVTQVKLVGAPDEDEQSQVLVIKATSAAYGDHTKAFGTIQEIIFDEDADTFTKAERVARQLLDERGGPRVRRRFVVPDVPFLRRGDRIVIGDEEAIVLGVQHDADQRLMTLEVA